ncbi:MAG: peptidase [Massilia sp.]|nr:peptidase [Massilia sp.]
MRKTTIQALIFSLALAAGIAHGAIKLGDPIPVGPQVKVGKLPNGLTYYIQKNSRPEKKLELRLVVKAGSILEDDDQRGLAHLLEHMAFNGSTHFKKWQLISYLQSIGVKFGADLNAYTSFDETVYMLPIPTDKPENVDQGFLVLEDWAHGLTLDDADIDKERAIVLEEARSGKGAGERMNKQLLPKMYNGSRYASRLPIGDETVLKTFKPAAVQRFYRDWYRPDLMAVVVVGDIEPARAESLIRAHFGKLANPATPRARNYAPIPARSATDALVITDKEASSNSVLIRYPVRPAHDHFSFADYRNKLVDSLFAAMLAQRLQDLTQQADPPFIGAGSALSRMTPRYQSYSAGATVGKGGAAPAIAALVQENERARQFGFSNLELERAKKDMLRSYERIYAERDKSNSSAFVAEYTRNFLEGEEIPGIENEYHYARELVPGISLAEINRYAGVTIPSDAAKLVVYLGSDKPGEAPTPKPAELLAWADAAARVKVTPLRESALAARLMERPPPAGSIITETVDAALGTTTLTLSNGVKVILKPTDFANDQVLLSSSRPGGLTQFGKDDVAAARYANAVVASMGVSSFSPNDLQKVLAGKAASAWVDFGQYSDNVGGNAGSGDIETMLQMLYLRFTNVRRDPALYQSFIGKEAEGARNVMAQPAAVFGDAVTSAMYGDSPWVARAPRPDDFGKLDLERSVALYRQRFASARGMTFIMVGSFDVAAVKPLLATYLASLPVPELPLTANDVGLRPATGVVKKAVYSGSEPKSLVALNFTGPASYSKEENLRFQALLEVMNIRITDVLREQLALIYSGGMSGSISRIPYEHYTIGASLPTGPEKVEQVLAATFAEIARLKESGPAPADLEKVKQNWVQVQRRAMRENGYWLGQLQSAVTYNTDPAAILTLEERIGAVSAADITAAAARYFNLDNYVQVVLYPEKKG